MNPDLELARAVVLVLAWAALLVLVVFAGVNFWCDVRRREHFVKTPQTKPTLSDASLVKRVDFSGRDTWPPGAVEDPHDFCRRCGGPVWRRANGTLLQVDHAPDCDARDE